MCATGGRGRVGKRVEKKVFEVGTCLYLLARRFKLNDARETFKDPPERTTSWGELGCHHHSYSIMSSRKRSQNGTVDDEHDEDVEKFFRMSRSILHGNGK